MGALTLQQRICFRDCTNQGSIKMWLTLPIAVPYVQKIEAVIHAADLPLTHARHIHPVLVLPDLQIAVLRLYQVLRATTPVRMRQCQLSPLLRDSTGCMCARVSEHLWHMSLCGLMGHDNSVHTLVNI